MGNSREEKKKFIGDLLKAADRYIKAAEYTEAMTEVNKALAVEPGNMYALAYNQRIKAALEALRKKDEETRVRQFSEEKKAAAKSAEPAEADAPVPEAETAEPRAEDASASEDDLYTIRQQRAQIERFKAEVESLRLKHQQEISVLAAEVQQARAAETEAVEKYRGIVDDAEESYRRVEELYAEVVRLNERIAESRRAADEERDTLTAEHRKETARLAEERETLVADHARELHRYEAEHGTLAEDRERVRRELEAEGEKRDAVHRQELARLAGETEKLQEAHRHEIHALTEDLRRAREAQTAAEENIRAAAAETTALQTALGKQEAVVREAAASDAQRQRMLGESLLRALLAKLLMADTITPEAQQFLNIMRGELAMSDEDYAQLQTAAKHDIYRDALKHAWDEGYITPEQSEHLAVLRRKIGISPESHFIIEDELRSAKKIR